MQVYYIGPKRINHYWYSIHVYCSGPKRRSLYRYNSYIQRIRPRLPNRHWYSMYFFLLSQKLQAANWPALAGSWESVPIFHGSANSQPIFGRCRTSKGLPWSWNPEEPSNCPPNRNQKPEIRNGEVEKRYCVSLYPAKNMEAIQSSINQLILNQQQSNSKLYSLSKKIDRISRDSQSNLPLRYDDIEGEKYYTKTTTRTCQQQKANTTLPPKAQTTAVSK